jgi:hypothetical protein
VGQRVQESQFSPGFFIGYDSAIQFSVDQTSSAASIHPMLFDIWAAMNAAGTNQNPILLPNFWPTPLTANSRGATGTGLIPIDGVNPAGRDLQVYHNFMLVGDALMVEIVVTNTDIAPHTVGLRLALNTGFGGVAQDGAPINLSTGTVVRNERVLPDAGLGGSLPTSWVSYDNPDNPLMSVKGLLDTPEIRRAGIADSSAGPPDAVEFGLWGHIAGAGMGFVPNPGISLMGEDWGVGVKWHEVNLVPGASRRYVTYIAFGASQGNYEPTWATLGYAPVRLIAHAGDDPSTPDTVEKFFLTDGDGRSPFPVAVYVDNFGNSSLPGAAATVTLPVGSGLTLFPASQGRTINLGSIPRNALGNATWTLNADQARPGLVTLGLAGPSGRDVSRQIQIPSIPVLVPRTSPNGLDMVSIPYNFANTDAEHVFADLGGLNPGQNGSLIRWDPTTLAYRWFPNPFVTNIVPGFGYWLLDKNGTTVALPADATPLPNDTNVNIPLVQGWNQIGNPFTLPVNFTDLRVNTTSDGTITMTDAISRELLQPALFSYVPASGTYTWETDLSKVIMTPYLGYWILAHQNLTLIVPPPGTVFGAAVRAQSLSGGQPGWRSAVQLSGEGLNVTRLFGEAPGAKDGADLLDVVAPPTPLAAAVDAAFVSPQTTVPATVADIKAQDKSSKTWYLQVSCSQPRSGLALSWPDLSTMPSDLVPVLEDVATGTRCYMRSTTRYSFSVAQPGTRLFKITVEPKSALAPMITGVQAQATAGGTFAIVYVLSAPCSVDVQIRNLAGLVVKHLSAGAVVAAGTNTVLWDGRSETGSKVPAGRYLCELAARAPSSGQASSVITTFEVSR